MAHDEGNNSALGAEQVPSQAISAGEDDQPAHNNDDNNNNTCNDKLQDYQYVFPASDCQSLRVMQWNVLSVKRGTY
jgi:hypothetical protein